MTVLPILHVNICSDQIFYSWCRSSVFFEVRSKCPQGPVKLVSKYKIFLMKYFKLLKKISETNASLIFQIWMSVTDAQLLQEFLSNHNFMFYKENMKHLRYMKRKVINKPQCLSTSSFFEHQCALFSLCFLKITILCY